MRSVGPSWGTSNDLRGDDRANGRLGLGVGETIEWRSDMGQQSMRQAARRAALDAQAQLRRERAERDKRKEALAVEVLTALEERKAAIVDCERRAGQALRDLTEREGLSVSQAAEWCAGELTTREVKRLVGLLCGSASESTTPQTVAALRNSS